ncbi:MAG TPA: hypothetical protein VGR57_18065, partial [Ktedonobacterales bacterium]|nr:hypothetical protein [Ktedonobacterales bacterium]
MTRHHAWRHALALPAAALALALSTAVAFALPQSTPFLQQFHDVAALASTVPAIGDLNPYGVAVV